MTYSTHLDIFSRMHRLYLLFFYIVTTTLIGCAPPEPNPAEGVKFTDIKPMFKDGITDEKVKCELIIHVLEVPVDNYPLFRQVWARLYDKGLAFQSKEAFVENGWLLGFGNDRKWSELDNIIVRTEARKSQTVHLVLEENLPDNFTVSKLGGIQELFYYIGQGQLAASTLKNGYAGLKFEAKKIAAARGILEFHVTPFFAKPGSIDSKEELFRHVGFQFDASPDEFVLLGPNEYDSRAGTLKGLYFANDGRFPAVKVFVISPHKIID